MKKKLLAVLMTVAMAGSLLVGCGGESKKDLSDVTVRIGGMSGPTSMGMVKLMEDSANGETALTYEWAELATEASAFVAPLSQGEIDIAAIPSNLAATVYNKTAGGVQVLAVNTYGVLDIVCRGDQEIDSIDDLAGKEIYATGQGATPEYTLRYLTKENSLDFEKDMTVKWCADTTEVLSYVAADENAIAMLPQPFVTVASTKVEDLKVALDLNDEWAAVNADCDIVTGVIVVRTEFAKANPEVVDAFLEEYEASVSYALEDSEAASALIEKYIGIGAKVAEKALPKCHITFLSGAKMKQTIEGYLQILFDENPAAIGGAMPGEDFYYGL